METVRCAIFRNKKQHHEVLMLKKDETSKNPHALEFPGGKMFDRCYQAFFYKYLPFKRLFQCYQIKREMWEETGLKVKCSDIYYLGKRKYKNSATGEITIIYNFYTILQDNPSISINNIGKEEDKHADFFWFSFSKFREYCRKREGAHQGFVCKNSRFPMLWRKVFA